MTQTNYIIATSALLFGSIYIFSISLNGINEMLIKNNKCSKNFIILNGSVLIISSSIMIYNFSRIKNSLV
jgi:hypothetical protein